MRDSPVVLECVVNISEGRDPDVVASIAAAAGDHLLDVHTDAHHHRSVVTIAGPDVVDRALGVIDATLAVIDLRTHRGVHPRLGAVDVVPFVPLEGSDIADAVAARDRLAAVIASKGVPIFLYGPERALPDVRRRAFVTLAPDAGPPSPHPTAGACCLGARPLLVAYNVWLARGATLDTARRVAGAVRSPGLRTLGLDVGGRMQVSCNLVDPDRIGPAEAFDAVAAVTDVDGAELVGLLPSRVLDRIAPHRWAELDVATDRTIEARLAQAGLGGS